MQVPLCGHQRSVAGDLAQHVDLHARVRHPCQAGVPQIVTHEVLVAQLLDDLVPVGRVPQGALANLAQPNSRERCP
jgi:hypothetical protein